MFDIQVNCRFVEHYMGSYSTSEVLNAAAVGVHHPALCMHELDLKGSMPGEELPTTSGLENGHQAPFVIG